MRGDAVRTTVYGNCSTRFIEDRLVNLCESDTGIQTGPFGSQLHQKDYVPFGTPIITVEHLGENRILHENTPCVSNEDKERLSKYSLRNGDIVFSRVGSVDRRALVRHEEDGWLFSGRCLRVRPNNKKIDSKYLSYFFGLPAFKEHIRSIAVGATMPSLNTSILSNISVPVPPLAEQHAIAHILGTLDDKIELNRRMNETLEGMARALFKSWFVDFDPVRRNAARKEKQQQPSPLAPLPAGEGTGGGKALRHPQPPSPTGRRDGDEGGFDTTAFDHLFPDAFEDSELGPIPKGWEVIPLPDAIAVNPTRSLRKGEVAPYLDMANMPTQGHTPDIVIDRPFGSGMRFVNGDTLVARITPCLENGKTAYVDFLENDQVGWGSTEYIVLRPKPPLPEEFAYCLSRSEIFREFAIQSMTGSSGRQRVPAESLSHYMLVKPPTQLAKLFGSWAKPVFKRASAAANESRTLAALRDTLLPKLISGELRVKDTKKLMEEVIG